MIISANQSQTITSRRINLYVMFRRMQYEKKNQKGLFQRAANIRKFYLSEPNLISVQMKSPELLGTAWNLCIIMAIPF